MTKRQIKAVIKELIAESKNKELALLAVLEAGSEALKQWEEPQNE